MTHEELVDVIDRQIVIAPSFALGGYTKFLHGLRAVVELHKPRENVWCSGCLDAEYYPCRTIQAIERNLA